MIKFLIMALAVFLVVGFILILGFSLCKVASESDKKMEEIYKKMREKNAKKE